MMNKEITIYELLGIIKDDKAPKKIHHQYYEYNWNGIDKDYQKNNGDTLLGNINIQHHLNDKVEIIEEYKPIIEKIEIKKYKFHNDNHSKLLKNQEQLSNKLNELIDLVNELKKEVKHD